MCREGWFASKAAVHVYIESGDGGKKIQSLSVDVSVVVADDWKETSRMRVTAGKVTVYHHLVVLGSFGRAVSADGVVADVGRAGSDDDPHINPEGAFAELRVGYDPPPQEKASNFFV